jgi:hypothetical protein
MRVNRVLLLFSTIVLFVYAKPQAPPKSAPAQASESPFTLPDQESIRLRLQAVMKRMYGKDAPERLTWEDAMPIQTMTKIGDVAEGIKIEESKGETELYLDKDPCKGNTIAFHYPYKKEDTYKTKKCGQKTFPILRGRQK